MSQRYFILFHYSPIQLQHTSNRITNNYLTKIKQEVGVTSPKIRTVFVLQQSLLRVVSREANNIVAEKSELIRTCQRYCSQQKTCKYCKQSSAKYFQASLVIKVGKSLNSRDIEPCWNTACMLMLIQQCLQENPRILILKRLLTLFSLSLASVLAHYLPAVSCF